MNKPNILIITTDQMRFDALSYFNTPGYCTPNLDALAKEGHVFDRAYCPAPLCTPARVSMISGLYPERHGAYTIGMSPVPVLQSEDLLGHQMKSAGYSCALVGKTHFVARKIEDAHVAGQDLSEVDGLELNAAIETEEGFWNDFDGPYAGFDFIRHHRHHNAAGQPSAHYLRWLKEKGCPIKEINDLHKGGNKASTEGCWVGMKPEWTQNAWIADESISFIEKTRETNEPWLLMANFQDPHYPYVCPEPYFSAVDMNHVDLGGLKTANAKGKPPFYDYFLKNNDWRDNADTAFWDGICVPNINHYAKVKNPQAAIQAYIGMVNMVDHYVGEIVNHLKKEGLFENTFILFTSDHGEQLGQHGVWGKGPMAYDDNQRIPAIVHWPAGMTLERQGESRHFNLVDIMPTCLDLAGQKDKPFLQGVSHLPWLKGEKLPERRWTMVDQLISQNQHFPDLETVDVHQQTFVYEDYKLVIYSHADYGELYDLGKDPRQDENLWHSDAELRHDLMQKMIQAHMKLSGRMPDRIGPN